MRIHARKMMSVVVIYWTLMFFGIWLGSANAQQQEEPLGPEVEEAQNGARLYRAWGEHTCWSDTSIGHTCRVENTGFTNCEEAYMRLEMERCCHLTEHGGSSVGFELKQCTWWH